MSDRETESFTPYEPQTSYDWDYGEEPPQGGGGGGMNLPNILWGRLVALGLLVIIVFLIGRWSAPDGVDAEELRAVQRELEESQEDVEELQAALTAQPTVTPSPSVTVGEQEDEAQDEEFDGETYVVQSGDTLRGIAEEFCGDATKDDLIAEFNGIPDPTVISVGAELMIPEDCGT